MRISEEREKLKKGDVMLMKKRTKNKLGKDEKRKIIRERTKGA